MKAVPKLTAKIMAGGEIKKPTERTLLATVYGEATSIKKSPSRFDPTKAEIKAVGHFECITPGGLELSAPVLFPPGGLADLIEGAGEGASFAVRIFIAPSQQTPVGYSFDFESAIEQKPSDRLQALRTAVLALPAPEGEKKGKAAK